MNAIMPRATAEDIVRYRDEAVRLFGIAHEKIAEADAAVKAAHEMARNCSPGINSYNFGHADEIKAFNAAVNLPDRERYLRTARRLTDINAWAWIIERTDLERLMDKEAKDKLRAAMAYVPERVNGAGQLINQQEIEKGLPPLTVDNILATLEQFMLDADMIFRRGIANAFSKLDRRFKSHDGFKIGSRVILTRAFNDWGSLDYGYVRDTLIDIERVFAMLDGKPAASFTSALNAVDADRRGRHGRRQSEVETEYFKIRGYMNGNAHLWFQRDDLVRKVNKLLAEHYGEVIGDGQQAEEDPFANVKTTPAKRYGFYPTPDTAAEIALEGVSLLRRADEPRLRILEPSAGTGNLARRCFSTPATEAAYDWQRERNEKFNREYRFDNIVECIEIQPHLVEQLRAEGIYHRVTCADFLQVQPDQAWLFDRVVMNPPFDRERDIDHVMHALKFLRPGGQLVAIMSAGTELRDTKKSVAFRELMQKMGADWRDMPAGSFAESGTYINTIRLKVWKPNA